MRKFLSAIVLAAAACGALAGESLLPNLDFEDANPSRGWNIPKNGVWSIQEGVGRRGSRALVWENSDPAQYSFCMTPFRVDEGSACYRLGGWVKVLSGEGYKPAISIEWSDANHKWQASCSAMKVVDNDPTTEGWVRYEIVTGVMPTNAVYANLLGYMPRGAVGKVLFDDFKLERQPIEPLEYLACSAYKNEFTPTDGAIRFVAAYNLNLVRNTFSDYTAEFTATDRKGEARTVPVKLTERDRVTFTLDAGMFAMGQQTVTFRLKLKGSVVGERTCEVTCVEKSTARRVWIDRYGRTIVDGKPFFPMGLYVNDAKEENVARFKGTAFNFVTQYGRVRREMLDRWQAAGVMVAPDVRTLIHGYNYSAVSRFTTAEESQAAFRQEIAAIGDHPALLAWYLVDEAPVDFIPNIAAANEFLRVADVNHPTYAVTDKPKDIRSLLPCFDVVGMDPYPIGNSGGRSKMRICGEWAENTRRDVFAMRPMWHVPQYFNWGWYRKGETNPDFHMPTRAEMLNMTWQGIAGGANGICGYTYGSVVRFTPEGPAREAIWADLCAVAAEIRSMEEVLLSVGETITLGDMPENLIARTYHQDGREWILIVNRTVEPQTATVKLPHRFTMLETKAGGGVTLAGETLKVAFEGLGYAFVAIK